MVVHILCFLFVLLSTHVQLAGKIFIAKGLPSMMGSENLPFSVLDKKQAQTQISLLPHKLSLKGNLVSGRLLEGFFTPPFLLSPCYTLVPGGHFMGKRDQVGA